MLNVMLAAMGGLAVVLGLLSRRLREWPISEPLAALAVGVALGPTGFGVIELPAGETDHILTVAARLALALSLMAVALRFPTHVYLRNVRAVALLITIVMVGMAAIGAGLGVAILGIPLAHAWLLGAAIAPTDPVLASSVVTGEPAEQSLPERLRAIISGESAANDTLAFPLVVLGVVAVSATTLSGGLTQIATKLLVGVVLGAAIGAAAGRALLFVERDHDLEHSAFLALTLSLALFSLGAVHLAGGEGILGVLATGLAYNHFISRADRREEWEVQEAINRFLVLPVFALLGMALPTEHWAVVGLAAVPFLLGVFLLRRLPLLLLVRRPLQLSTSEALFAGWFGPIGVAALYYLAHGRENSHVSEEVWAAGTLAIVASTIVHGVTATAGRRAFARRQSTAEQPARSAAPTA